MKGMKLLQALGIGIALAAMAGCETVSVPIPSTSQPTPTVVLTPEAALSPQPTPTVVLTPVAALSPQPAPGEEPDQLAPPLMGHVDWVTHLDFSRDGKTLVSGSDDGSVILWDVRNLAAPARLGRPLGNDDSRVRSFALSPDGKILVVSTSSGTPPPMHIYIWDISNPAAPVLLGEPPPVTGGFVVMHTLAFSPDGQVLAIGSEDRTVTLWDMTDPTTPVPLGSPLEGHESGVLQVAFSPDGGLLASGDGDGVVVLWTLSDPEAPRKLSTIVGQEDAVSALAFSPDGKTLAVGGEGEVRLWDVSSASTLAVLDALPTGEYEKGVKLDFSPDGSTMATSSGNMIILWDVADRRAPTRLITSRLTDDIYSVALSSDGQTLATGSGDGTIILSSVSQPDSTALSPASPIPAPLPAAEWPVLPLTEQEIASVNECDIEGIASEHYPDTIMTDDLQSVFAPQTGCEWAALALAYAYRLDDAESLSEAARGAFSQAVSRNFGFAFATPIFYSYFGTTPLVEAPDFAQQEITDVDIEYNWAGLGDPVDYALEIHQANTTPTFSVNPDRLSTSLRTGIDKQLLQALGPALTDLLPVESRFTLSPCFDNYPDWDVTLTFADGAEINLATDSNFLYFGGPWFAEIDHQSYVQYSTAFAEALRELVLALGLPIGEPAGMACRGVSVFDKAFP